MHNYLVPERKLVSLKALLIIFLISVISSKNLFSSTVNEDELYVIGSTRSQGKINAVRKQTHGKNVDLSYKDIKAITVDA